MARIFELHRKSTLALRQRKQALLRQLHVPPNLLRASFVKQFLTCGKPACPCHQSPDRKHGPYYYLLLCLGPSQIRKFSLKEPQQQNQAGDGTAAYTQVRGGGEGLWQGSAELLRGGDPLQPE